jgi:hypothetical protein
MRISATQLAGLAVLLSGASTNALAQTTINTATTTPVQTSTTGDLLLDTAGSITIDSGQTAITVNSNNTVELQGNLSATDESNITGILIQGPRTGDIELSGNITFTEAYLRTDTDNDGNPDGGWASATNVHGLVLSGGTFTGDIHGDGLMNIEGNNSSGITLNSLLDGDLIYTGTINVTGDNSYGVAINNGVTGDVLVRGGVSTRGLNSTALAVNSTVDGELRLNGGWLVTGYSFVTRPSDTVIAGLDADDLFQAGPAVAIRGSVDGGVTLEGIGVENDEDDDGDGETDAENDSDDNRTLSIESYGPGAAILVEAATSNITLGANVAPGEYGFVNRGSLRGDGVYDNIEAYGLQVRGIGGNTATIVGGILNDGQINVSANEANAYAIFAGADSIIDEIVNRKTIGSFVTTDATDTAYGIYVDANAQVSELTNSGSIRAVQVGETGHAYAIYDASGTVTQFTNSGFVQALLGTSDGTTPTGDRVAIDFSNALAGVTIDQIADTPFTDDDAEDDDEDTRPEIIINGEVRLGAFDDTVNLLAGAIVGDMSFGNGADEFNIDGEGYYLGVLSDTDGNLNINVADGTLDLFEGTVVGITNAQFSGDSRLVVHLGGVPVTITASGTVTFAPGAEIVPIVPGGLPASGSHTFLIANNLTVDAGSLGPLTGEGVSYLYSISINEVGETLEAAYTRKNAAQLGLNNAQAAGLNPILTALQGDLAAATALAGLDNQDDFLDAYADLMPNYAGGATELAATAIQQLQSATTNRLATTRLRNLDEVSVWAQEIGYGVSRTPEGNQGLKFRGQGFGIAGGIDGPLDSGGLFGLSLAMLTSEMEEPGRPEGELSSTFVQGNAYLGTAAGPFDLDFVGGVGAGQMNSRRFIEIGTTYSARTEAEWWAFEGHGAARASLPMRVSDWLIVTPQTALTYVALSEQDYQEEGAGALDYEVDSAFSQRLWADVGVELSGRLALGGRNSFIAPRLYVGYRANAIDEASERTVRFVSGGADFTVQDDTLGQGGPLVGLGIDATNGHSTFSIAYEGEFGDQVERHSLNAAIRFRF